MMFEYTRRKPRGIDHLKWWSPVWGFVLKLAVTAALFYGWRSEHPLPDDIHIHGKLFQYATEEWEGQHLVFLMLAIGLTFITVEKRRKDGKLVFPEESDHVHVCPAQVPAGQMSLYERIWHIFMSRKAHDARAGQNITCNYQGDVENPNDADLYADVDGVTTNRGLAEPDTTSELSARGDTVRILTPD